jgi:hypothetical protein
MELREKIRERHGVGFGYGTVWRFLARHRITKSGSEKRSKTAVSNGNKGKRKRDSLK